MVLENKFYKVNESGFCLSCCMFYNPVTKESFSKIVWDMDDDRKYDDAETQRLRFLELNKDARWVWLHDAGVIQKGDMVEVVKGRKVPIGYKGVVANIYPYYDRYRRHVADYAYFTDGTKTNVDNLKLI